MGAFLREAGSLVVKAVKRTSKPNGHVTHAEFDVLDKKVDEIQVELADLRGYLRGKLGP